MNMLKFYKDNKIWFAVVWIVAYCVLMSIGDALSDLVGVQKCITLPVAFLMTAVLFIFIKKYSLAKENGLCKPELPAKNAIFYLPLALMVSVNAWYGVALNGNVLDSVLSAGTMLLVGVLEEVIFRAFLFNALKQENFNVAVVVSSLTFGMGHVINLLGGADVLLTLMQIIYATCAGFAFVIIYIKTNSIVPCIVAHSLLNALSVFSAQDPKDVVASAITAGVLVVTSVSYALYFIFAIKNKKE